MFCSHEIKVHKIQTVAFKSPEPMRLMLYPVPLRAPPACLHPNTRSSGFVLVLAGEAEGV